MAPIVERILEIPSLALGEGPHWDAATQSLYFIDVFKNSVHKYVPATKQHSKAVLEKSPSIVIPVKGQKDQFLITQEDEIVIITWDGKSEKPTKVEKITDVEGGSGNKLNDGKCDSKGRLWIGTLNPEFSNRPEVGSLYSLSGGQAKAHLNKISVSNGLTWDIKLGKFYFIDSTTKKVDAFDYDLATDSISNRTTIFTLEKHGIAGMPDGMTIDVDGNLWVAIFNGSRVIKIDPRKPELLLEIIEFPAKQITSLIWGGPKMDILYVTSGCFNIPGADEELQPPNNGAVFKVTGLGTHGLEGENFDLQSF